MVLLLALAGVCTKYIFTFRPGVAQCGTLLGFFCSLKRGEKTKKSKQEVTLKWPLCESCAEETQGTPST